MKIPTRTSFFGSLAVHVHLVGAAVQPRVNGARFWNVEGQMKIDATTGAVNKKIPRSIVYGRLSMQT